MTVKLQRLAVVLLLLFLFFNGAAGSQVSWSSSAPFCSSGWTETPDKKNCVVSITTFLPWEKSEEVCQGYNAHLVALTSPEDLNLVQSLCAAADTKNDNTDTTKGCWIGGRGRKTSMGYEWRWSDNVSVWNQSIFHRRQPFLPNCTSASSCRNLDLTKYCTLVTSGRGGSLVGERCGAGHGFLCMTETRRGGIKDICHGKKCHKEYLIILGVVSLFILTTTLAVVVWLLVYKRGRSKRRRRSRKTAAASGGGNLEITLVPQPWKVFSGDELRSITKNFSEGNRLVGDAKTGGTYTGIFSDGTKVAVKRLRRSKLQRKKEFYSEIGRVVRLHHPNLIAIKGGCYDHGSRYIVYEFVTNGPLDRWLHFIPRGGRCLDWAKRLKVAASLAQGIAFLHDKVKPQVVHRDIRACNVLLDEEFQAHLMGVGLSKFVAWEVMHERTLAAATYGYLAPEFIYRNELTTKSDVYSFGVLLLEIISGRRPTQNVESVGWQSIFEWATPLVQSHSYPDLLDPLITDVPESGVIQKVVDLVYACTQHVPSVRPRMSHVVHQLQQIVLKTAAKSSTSTSSSSPMKMKNIIA